MISTALFLYLFLGAALLAALSLASVVRRWVRRAQSNPVEASGHHAGEARRKNIARASAHGLFGVVATLICVLALVPAQFERAEYLQVLLTLFACGLVWVGYGVLWPGRTGGILAWVHGGIAVLLLVELGRSLLVYPANAVTLGYPLMPPAVFLQAGASPLFNHHFVSVNQRHAVDLIVAAPRVGEPARERSSGLGSPVFAPLGGVVRAAYHELADATGQATDLERPEGNYLVIEIEGGLYLLLAHLRQGSIVVAPGERVQAGIKVAELGNSGNSTEPHLHLQVQTHVDLWDPNCTTVPVVFSRDVGEHEAHRAHESPRFPRRNVVLD